jgi:hypothetical protein
MQIMLKNKEETNVKEVEHRVEGKNEIAKNWI